MTTREELTPGEGRFFIRKCKNIKTAFLSNLPNTYKYSSTENHGVNHKMQKLFHLFSQGSILKIYLDNFSKKLKKRSYFQVTWIAIKLTSESKLRYAL